jgi:hypothetical protein
VVGSARRGPLSQEDEVMTDKIIDLEKLRQQRATEQQAHFETLRSLAEKNGILSDAITACVTELVHANCSFPEIAAALRRAASEIDCF